MCLLLFIIVVVWHYIFINYKKLAIKIVIIMLFHFVLNYIQINNNNKCYKYCAK